MSFMASSYKDSFPLREIRGASETELWDGAIAKCA